MLGLLCGLSLAGEPNYQMTVEAHKDIEVYVAPTKVVNETNIPYQLDATSVFGHTLEDVKWIQKKTLYGYERIDEPVNVYNADTIKYAWPDCNYDKQPKDCSFKNGHYLLESHITFDKQQVTIRLILYNEQMVPVGQSVTTNTRVVKITEREKTTRQVGQATNGQVSSCGPTSCPVQQPRATTSVYSQTTREDLEPSVVIIEPRLLDRDIKQASMSLWTSIRIN